LGKKIAGEGRRTVHHWLRVPKEEGKEWHERENPGAEKSPGAQHALFDPLVLPVSFFSPDNREKA